MITQERLKEGYDYKDGYLYYRKPKPKVKVGDKAGWTRPDGYCGMTVDGKTYPTHHLIWLWNYGVLPKYVDHIDRNPRNNKIENLRLATVSQNQHNTKTRCDNTSGVKGVNWCKMTNKWRARVQVENRRINLGAFETVEAAKVAIQDARQNLHGEFHRHA